MTEASAFRSPIDMALSSGRKLIEASAGSGKTRAITTLVVRLVVEDGRELDSILVVTFTKALGLRERIRKLLREIRNVSRVAPAALCFRRRSGKRTSRKMDYRKPR